MALLTILATKPDVEAATGQDDTGFIDTAAARFGKTTTQLVRASSMSEIDAWLKNAEKTAKAPLDVQIVGHGTGGQLALGMTWLAGVDAPAVSRSFPYYLLDTNPAALQLLRHHIGQLRRLSLIGCNVGSLKTLDCIVNGRSLTYVLCELLQCDVLASVDVVAETDFDAATGEFTGAVTGWTWNADGAPTWLPAVPAAPHVPDGDPRPFEIDKIHHTFFSRSNAGPRDITNARAMAVKIENPKLKWATPEITVNVKDRGFGALIGNARYLVMGNEQYAVANHDELYNALREPFLG